MNSVIADSRASAVDRSGTVPGVRERRTGASRRIGAVAAGPAVGERDLTLEFKLAAAGKAGRAAVPLAMAQPHLGASIAPHARALVLPCLLPMATGRVGRVRCHTAVRVTVSLVPSVRALSLMLLSASPGTG